LDIQMPWSDVDFRLPLALRASVTPSVSDEREGRAHYYGADINHVSEVEHDVRWKYQLALTAGAMVHF
jgi:hypothetical protein